MGLTTTAVYITLAALIIPSLERMDVAPMAAHMFAFYFGVVSTITPPVALASFAAAGIARTPPMATAVESAKVGVTKYLVPFIFVYNPSLLFQGPLWLTAFSTVTALAGVWVLSMAMEGWLHGPLSVPFRLGFLGSAVLLLYPPQLLFLGQSGYTVTLIGAAGLVALYVARLNARRARVAVSNG
jgi:TRAP-type uncharacterized transport system fused permease subunit